MVHLEIGVESCPFVSGVVFYILICDTPIVEFKLGYCVLCCIYVGSRSSKVE